MIPIKHSTIFRSRWWALLWAVGIIWFAYDFAGTSGDSANAPANAEAPTDATGAPVTNEDEQKLAQALNGF
jgi:hypothetical protein